MNTDLLEIFKYLMGVVETLVDKAPLESATLTVITVIQEFLRTLDGQEITPETRLEIQAKIEGILRDAGLAEVLA